MSVIIPERDDHRAVVILECELARLIEQRLWMGTEMGNVWIGTALRDLMRETLDRLGLDYVRP